MKQNPLIMNKSIENMKSQIKNKQADVKAAHLSSNPINNTHHHIGNAHFEVEVQKAFLKIFFGR